MSEATFNTAENNFTLKKDHNILSKIEGEWIRNIKFDDVVYWSYADSKHCDLRRMAFTLPSDSTVREDLVMFKRRSEEEADAAKIKLEELQRKDRKLRTSKLKQEH